MKNNKLVIALPKGRLGEEALELLKETGLPIDGVEVESRILQFEVNDVRYLICKPTDVPIFVEHGIADIGIVGKDTIEEEKRDVFELLDLGFGKCHFSVAVPKVLAYKFGSPFPLYQFNHKRVATKFINVAEEFFAGEGLQMELIKLHGNVELAATIGLADMIVDIVSTGTTLRENGLVEVKEIFQASARLIANRVSYRVKNEQLFKLTEDIKKIINKRGN
ncbi:MAG: ATP phosphoribosyltransferase [Firmicutes bacterium]|nr:ATP phosphoribosyltransferase [Bacillota bacterium]